MRGQKRSFEQAVEDATSVAGGPASGSLDVDELHSGCRRLKQCFEYGDCIDYFGRPPLVRSCDICVDVSADGTSCMGCDMYFCARCTRGGACIGRDCMCSCLADSFTHGRFDRLFRRRCEARAC